MKWEWGGGGGKVWKCVGREGGDWGRLARLSFSSYLVSGVNKRKRWADARNEGGIIAPSVTRKVVRVSRVPLDGLGKKERLLIV